MKKSLLTLIGVCIIASLVGVSVAAAVAPIWSNSVSTTITQKAWSGTVVLSGVQASYNTGDSITLTATLNPLPSQYQVQQAVTFYYSESPISASPDINALKFVGGTKAASTVTTQSGVAQLTFTSATTGTFYFIAEIESPV